MKVFIVGIGTDGISTLTREAEKAVSESELIIGAERMVRRYEDSGKEIFINYDPEKITEKIKNSRAEKISVLMSGDCGFFSGAKKLVPMLENEVGCETEMIGGISSAVYFCAKTGISYENMKFISLHTYDAVIGKIAVNVRMNEKCFFLLGGNYPAFFLCRRLCDYGLKDVKIYIGENLGYENEKIICGSAEELADYRGEKLAVLIAVNEDHIDYIPSGINDDEFIRDDKIPMTKSEVRCIAVSGLNIAHDSVCWDIGSGSGSVSVEAAFRCPDGKVCAFDRSSEAYRLTRENACKFGCDNIIAVKGECPDILEDAESPDKVFIGGSSGRLKEIFQCVYNKNPYADITVTAVSVETLGESVRLFEEYGGSFSVTQAAVTRTKRIGRHTMFNALNPVYIIKGTLNK